MAQNRLSWKHSGFSIDNSVMLYPQKEYTFKQDGYFHIEYTHWADDFVILIDGHRKWNWLKDAVFRRLKQELNKIGVIINEEKTKIVDISKKRIVQFPGI